MAVKTYCGNAKTGKDKFGNDFLMLKMEDKDVLALQQQVSVNKQNGVTGVTIYVSKRKEPSQYGYTHYGTLATDQKPYKGNGQGNGQGNGGQGGGYGGGQNGGQQAPKQEHRYNAPDDFPPAFN